MTELLAGIDVGGTNIKIMLMNTAMEAVVFHSIPTGYERGYDAVAEEIIAEIEALIARAGIGEWRIISAAMGLPGTVFRKEQKTGFLSLLMWNGFNPCKKIGEYFNAKYLIENDGNLNALGEYRFGINRRVGNMVLFTLGSGVGGGIIINGSLYGGMNNQAAELGHMTLEAEGGERCPCGRYGHLESYCSGKLLEKYALEHLEEHPASLLRRYIAEKGSYDTALLDQGVREQDPYCMKLYRRFTTYLALGVANVMKILNPELIVLGGGIANAGELLLAPLREEVKKHLLDMGQNCPIEQSVLGSKAGVYGACALAAEAVNLSGRL
jgi:glucokinase